MYCCLKSHQQPLNGGEMYHRKMTPEFKTICQRINPLEFSIIYWICALKKFILMHIEKYPARSYQSTAL